MSNTILIVEDDRAILEGLRINLENEGFIVMAAETGKQALELFKKHAQELDLALLDIMLPDISGLEILKEIKAQRNSLPVLFLTARNDIYDKISGFTLGADDYITKPFDIRELVLRIKARLRSLESNVKESISFGNIRIDLASFRVFKNDSELEFTKIEFEILNYFYQNKGIVLTREQLLERLWGFSSDVTSRAVDMHISKIRKKIEDDPRKPEYIKTVFGVGYKLDCK